MNEWSLISEAIQFYLVALGGPLIALWGITVTHRCTAASTQQRVRILVVAMVVWLVVGALSGSTLGVVSIVSNLIIALAIELCIGFGIIQSAHGFRTLFRRLPLDVKIANYGAREIYRTDISRTLDLTTLKQLVDQAPPAGSADGAVTVRLDGFPDTPFKVYRLRGGVAIVAEDLSEINQQTRKLQAIRDDLTRQNELIAHDRDIERALYRQQRERELSTRVGRDLSEAAASIGRLLDTLPPLSDEHSASERIKQLNHVKTLVAYSKRKGMLALEAAESEFITQEAFRLITVETCADLSSIGIESAILMEMQHDPTVDVVNALYDCFYDCIIAVLPFAQPVIMTYITAGEDKEVYMRTSIECAIGLSSEDALELIPKIATSTEAWDAVQSQIAKSLESRLDKRGVEYNMISDEGLVNVNIVVREGGNF